MRLQNKLFLVSLLGSALLVGAMFTLMQWSVDRGMLDYVNTRERIQRQEVAELLGNFYRRNNGFDALSENTRLLQDIAAGFRGGRRVREGRRPESGGRGGPPGGRDRQRQHPGGGAGPGAGPHPEPVVLIDENGQVLAGYLRPDREYQKLPIDIDGNVVGFLAYAQSKKISEGYELSFLQQQRETFLLISLLVLLAAGLTSLPVARHVVAPLKKLAKSSRKMAAGDFSQRQDVQRRDELGELARAFNHLGESLEQTDAARKRWLADTSHELRTPIAILRGELEAMLDGVRDTTRKNLQSVHAESLHLGKLVDDLHELSNADIGAMRYQMEEVDIASLSREAAQQADVLFEKASVRLDLTAPPREIIVWGDALRLSQLLTNLLSNSARYTDAGGSAVLLLGTEGNNAVISVEDTAPGVPTEALSLLFDHLYRVEQSRSRASGGSGLGLALCRRIVEAHGGNIEARHSEKGGVQVRVTLPLLGGQSPGDMIWRALRY